MSKIETTTIEVDHNLATGEFDHRLENDYSGILIMPGIGWNPVMDLHLRAGFAGMYVAGHDYSQEEVIVKPANNGIFPETGAYYRNRNSGEMPDYSEFVGAVRVSAGYEFPLNRSKSLTIMPQIGYEFGLNDLVKDITWKSNAMFAGFSVMYHWREAPPEPPKPMPLPEMPEPEPEPEPIAKGPSLQGAFEFDAVGLKEGEEIYEVEFLIEEYLASELKPLLTYLFFAHNSAEIPARYKIMKENEIAGFDINKISGGETLDIYYDLLNIIGKRMTLHPDAEITLTGCNSNHEEETGNTALSRDRAEVVKEYLTQRWNIDDNRIGIKTRNLPSEPSNPKKSDGREENRRVEIHSATWEIIAPIIHSDTSRKISPPTIRFKTSTDYKSENVSWTIRLAQSGKLIKKYQGKGIPEDILDYTFDKSIKLLDSSPLEYELKVTDHDKDSTIKIAESIPMEILTLRKKRLTGSENYRIDKYGLILFPFDKAVITDHNKRITRLINRRINKKSEVGVKAYTDKIGDDDYNMKLSQRRAASAANSLEGNNIEADGLGESVLLYDNSLPEGRFYSRTVEVIVKTPIE
jgi:outer membrane protein OmpA-like peptidoglycan-associated protein